MRAGPTHAIVAVTNRCNARCSMCDIWKRGPTPELSPKDYERLPSSLREINVTGGEPLLREDLAEVILALKRRCPHVRIVLSTNGLLPERLHKVLPLVGPISLRVSIDGLGELHDRIRGVQGAYAKAIETLKVARDYGIRDVGICATMSRHNAGVIGDIQGMARKQGVQFSFTVTHSSPVFFGDKHEEEPPADVAIRDMEQVRSRLFASRNPKDWFKAYFVEGLIDVERGLPRPLRCRAGLDFFYLDAEGNLYPCHLWDRKIGNIREKSFDQILSENPATPQAVRGCRRRCWMTCTVAPEMRRRLPVFAVRVGWARARHHLKTLSKRR